MTHSYQCSHFVDLGHRKLKHKCKTLLAVSLVIILIYLGMYISSNIRLFDFNYNCPLIDISTEKKKKSVTVQQQQQQLLDHMM
jgi:uncharacterized protein YxeA